MGNPPKHKGRAESTTRKENETRERERERESEREAARDSYEARWRTTSVTATVLCFAVQRPGEQNQIKIRPSAWLRAVENVHAFYTTINTGVLDKPNLIGVTDFGQCNSSEANIQI